MSGNILEVSGRYDLGAAIRFLEGWPPTAGENRQRSTLRWSMCLESSWEPIGVTVVQGADGIEFEYVGSADQDDVAVHVARVLSLDVDARGFDDVGDRDPIAGSILADFPGLRPVCCWTPYEAAVWGVISQRSSRVTASRVKKHMARELGDRIGDRMHFPVRVVSSNWRVSRVSRRSRSNGCGRLRVLPSPGGSIPGGCDRAVSRRRSHVSGRSKE